MLFRAFEVGWYLEWALAILMLIGVIYLKINYYKIWGWLGERFVRNKLKELDTKRYIILNDLLFPSDNGIGSVQIDHVVVSNYGIFCIETKNLGGWISGDTKKTFWIQSYLKFKKKYFYSPLLQNESHVKAIKKLVLPVLPKTQIFSFVAFPIASNILISDDRVGHVKDIIHKIKSYISFNLTDTQRDQAVEILLKANILDKHARRLHDKKTSIYHKKALKAANKS